MNLSILRRISISSGKYLKCTKRAQHTLTLDGCSLSPTQLVRAAGDPSVKVEVSSQNWDTIQKSRDVTMNFARGSKIVYGINTSCGSLVDRLLPQEDLMEFQKNLIRCIATQVGEPFPLPIVRATMIDRVNSLCRGISGIEPANLGIYLEMINKRVYPVIPQQGSLGASGDLGPLGCIALVAIGEWQAVYQGKRMTGAEAMAAAGIQPMQLGPKEGLAMINGTSCMASLSSHVVVDAITTAKTAHAIAALSLEGNLVNVFLFSLTIYVFQDCLHTVVHLIVELIV